MCIRDSVFITNIEINPMVAINSESCAGQADASIVIDTVIGGQAPYLFALNSNNFSTNNLFGNLTGGTYDLFIQDADGCETLTEIIIPSTTPLLVNLGEDQQIQLGDSVQLSAITTNAPDTIIWQANDAESNERVSCPTCLRTYVQPNFETTYTVTVMDAEGCTASNDITIFVDKTKRVYIPNVFSPNQDGINDEFKIQGLSLIHISEPTRPY